MPHFRKVRAGDPLRIPARAYNAFVDAAHVAQRINADVVNDPAFPGAGVHEHLVLVRNETGQDLPRFGALGIAGPIIEPGPPGDGGNDDEFKRRTALIGAPITTTDEYAGRFVIAREPIADGRIGLAVIRGVAIAIVNVVDDEHTHADTFPDQQFLYSGFTGAARILWKEQGTGQKLAILEMGPADRDRFPARLGDASPIDGRPFGWLYAWEEVRLDADPFSLTFGQYIRPIGSAAEGWLASNAEPTKLAFNRYEAHLSVAHAQQGGTEGFANGGACLIPGALENCPPHRAAVPMLCPIPMGVVVELRAERTFQAETRFVFEAMNPIELQEMNVPEAWYA